MKIFRVTWSTAQRGMNSALVWAPNLWEAAVQTAAAIEFATYIHKVALAPKPKKDKRGNKVTDLFPGIPAVDHLDEDDDDPPPEAEA
jgi:hypothetical protein